MSTKARIEKLEAAAGSMTRQDGPSIAEQVAEILADPARVAAEIAWDEKYLLSDSPFHIDLTGMSREERGAAIEAAYASDPADGPNFEPWKHGPEEGGQL